MRSPSRAGSGATRPAVHPVVLVLLAVVSVQFGGALAVTLLPMVGVLGSVALRLTLAEQVARIIRSAMSLLGINVPERM